MKTKAMKLLGITLIALLLMGLMPMATFAAQSIDCVDILALHPVHLETPDMLVQVFGGARIDTDYNSGGYINGIRWTEEPSGMLLNEQSSFKGGVAYKLSVRLFANSGYAFSTSSTKAKVNFEDASITVQDMNHACITVDLVADRLYVNYVNISGLTAPKVDDNPDYTASADDEGYEIYSVQNLSQRNGIIWKDVTNNKNLSIGDKFQPNVQYAAYIHVRTLDGYMFPSGFLISVDGRTATADIYTDSTLTVKVVFPTLVENTPSHTHTPSEWRTTQVYHYKVCTECGDMLDSEDHFGGKATCAEKGKCAECGYEYIEANEDHDPDTSKWVAYADKYHFHACKICGAHCDTEDHTPGEPADFDKAQVCTDCGYILAPALLHKHELTRVERKDATCTEAGNIEHYTCNGCSEIFADEDGINAIPDATIAPLGHKLSDGFTNDGEYHWRTCSVCNEVLEETKMAHEYENGRCMTCNFEAQPSESSTDDKSDTTSSTDTSADTSTDPSDASEPEPIEEDGGMPWWAIALIAVGCIAVVTVIAVFATKNKKKS